MKISESLVINTSVLAVIIVFLFFMSGCTFIHSSDPAWSWPKEMEASRNG